MRAANTNVSMYFSSVRLNGGTRPHHVTGSEAPLPPTRTEQRGGDFRKYPECPVSSFSLTSVIDAAANGSLRSDDTDPAIAGVDSTAQSGHRH